jgi:hypothetical protein
MAAISIFKPLERPDFSALVLRGLADIGHHEGELCLELGVSYWITSSETRLDEAVPAMLAMRDALIGASGLSQATEPVPLWGVRPRVDVLNLATYLRGLIVRAAHHARCRPEALVEQALLLIEADVRAALPMKASG